MIHAQVQIDEDAREEAVFNAISGITQEELNRLGGWNELDILSSATLYEGLEAVPGGMVFHQDGGFEAAATVYVTLQFGPSRDRETMSDAYPAIVKGQIDNELSVEIENIDVDTESFYQD
jgi:hypothetical protein